MSKPRRQASKASKSSGPSRSHSELPTSEKKKRTRHPTVYDAVAGRVSTQGFIPSRPQISWTRDTPSSSTVPIPPEEVLFRSRKAPERYEENDIYWANRHLRQDQPLPASDLLKALHAYAADFYGRTLGKDAEVSYGSLDGSALLALGVLMEEAIRGVLGETGDLAFVEGEKVEVVDGHEEQDELIQKTKPSSADDEALVKPGAAAFEDGSTPDKTRKRKKRKVNHNTDNKS